LETPDDHAATNKDVTDGNKERGEDHATVRLNLPSAHVREEEH
jgi:hypothetical protein